MQVSPYLHFNGNCEAAFKYYEKVLGAKVVMMLTHEDAPPDMPTPPEWKKKIMHARLDINGAVLMGGDAPPDHYHKPKGFSVSLQVKDPAEAERFFKALSEDATVQMPIQQTFWSPRFGMLIDQFGIPWMINCEPA